MQFTLKDVMDIEVMNLAKILSAQDTLSQRSVESISVIEIPVENFVRKNEFVLTTAIGCNHDVKVFKKFVKDVLESEAAALAIAIGRHVLEIPKEIITFAEKNHFPLIEIPWELRFADITHSVLSRLNQWQKTALERSEEMQKQLLNLFLRDASLSEAAEEIRQGTGYSVLIVDKDGSIKGKCNDAGDLSERWQNHFHNQVRNELWTSVQADPDPAVTGWIKQLDDSMVQLKIQTGNKTHGYLILSLSGTSPESFFTSGEEYVLEHAVTAAALWFQRENAIQETELRLRDDFVWSLAKGEIDSWDTVLSRAKSLNFNVNRPYVCILGLPENMETVYKKSKSIQTTYDQWHQMMIRSIEEQLVNAGKAIQRETMTTYHHDRFVIFLEGPLDPVNNPVKLYLDGVESRIRNLVPDLILSWGIGENHAGIKTFHESFNDARIALEIGTRQKGSGHRSTYANTGIYRALLSLSNNPEIQEITLSTIGALIDYDQQRGLDLVHTLIAYIRTQGNVSETSRALSLHRQSLLYRLRKIESLTGRSLEDPDDLFLLDLSVKLWMTGMMVNQKERH
jgi:purine catabolism regulator